MFLTDAMAFTL